MSLTQPASELALAFLYMDSASGPQAWTSREEMACSIIIMLRVSEPLAASASFARQPYLDSEPQGTAPPVWLGSVNLMLLEIPVQEKDRIHTW